MIMEERKNVLYNYLMQELDNIEPLANYCDYYSTLRRDTLSIEKEIKDLIDDDAFECYKKTRTQLMSIFVEYQKGNISTASNKMRNLLFGRDIFIRHFLCMYEGGTLYRLRYATIHEKDAIEMDFYNQLFHVPYNSRHMVKNYRYSVSGFPCLYLGSSVHCCKNELNIESQSNDYVGAKFKTTSFLMYDFSKIALSEELFDAKLKEFLKKYLLIYATSFYQSLELRTCEKNEKVIFFPYYVISQLITAAIASKEKEVRCIRYSSVRCDNEENYVFIPNVTDFRKKDIYDEALRSRFEIELLERENDI